MKANSLFAAMLGTSLLAVPVVYAGEFTETEPNNDISINAQKLGEADTEEIVRGAIMGTLGGDSHNKDVDYYSFYGERGDEIIIDIDNGWAGTGTEPVNTIVALFTPGSYVMERQNIYDDSGDDLSGGYREDAFISLTKGIGEAGVIGHDLEKTGTYIIAVSSFPRVWVDGGILDQRYVTWPYAYANGDYDLIVTFINRETEPSVQAVDLEIKPGNKEKWAPINPKSRGKIPVAILSTPSLHAVADIDTDSLTFGSTGDEASLYKCHKGKDVNGDGRLDLLCHFENQAANFKDTDVEGAIKGSLKDGTAIMGRAPLKVVPKFK
jgi:hypothetical protein